MSYFTLTQDSYTSLTRKLFELIIVNIIISVPDNKPAQTILIFISIRATYQLISRRLTENTSYTTRQIMYCLYVLLSIYFINKYKKSDSFKIKKKKNVKKKLNIFKKKMLCILNEHTYKCIKFRTTKL